MSKKLRLTERTRTLLTLELAIVLPAAALMGFSIWNLKHIQRSEAVQAAFERDFSHVLRIAEKKSLERANDLLTPVRKEFPNPDDGDSKIKAGLRRILLEHPEYRFAGLYDKKNNLLLTRLQPGHEQDEVFCALTQEEIKGVASWLPLEASKMVEGVRTAAEKEERPVGFEGWWTGAENQQTYWNFAYFIPPGVAKDRVTLGMVAFDGDYLRKSFLPAMMKDVLTSKSIVLRDRKSTRLNSSHGYISYAVFCLKKKKNYRQAPGGIMGGDTNDPTPHPRAPVSEAGLRRVHVVRCARPCSTLASWHSLPCTASPK